MPPSRLSRTEVEGGARPVKSELLGRLALKPSDPPQQVEGDVAAHDGRGLQHAPLALREVIEEGRDHRLHGNRDLDLADAPCTT
jgi:hypothetical protein